MHEMRLKVAVRVPLLISSDSTRLVVSMMPSHCAYRTNHLENVRTSSEHPVKNGRALSISSAQQMTYHSES